MSSIQGARELLREVRFVGTDYRRAVFCLATVYEYLRELPHSPKRGELLRERQILRKEFLERISDACDNPLLI